MTDHPSLTESAAADVENFRYVFDNIRHQVGQVVVGQNEVVDHLLITLLVGGHCLITGMPGTAKTLLVRTLSEALGLQHNRIQFTPDLMPTDITGTDIISEDGSGQRNWSFVPGPIFTNVLLADEINRTPPKTQAALLEAMQENSATVRGTLHQLPQPFFVLATQNPLELEGTYPLPEAQLDRFLFNILLDYLDADDELEVVARFTGERSTPNPTPCTNAEQIMQFQHLVRQVPVSESVAKHAVNLVRATRPAYSNADLVRRYVKFGASVRATLFLTLSAKARALMEGRYHVTHEDINALAAPVLRHRVLLNYFAESDGVSMEDILGDAIHSLSAQSNR